MDLTGFDFCVHAKETSGSTKAGIFLTS